MRDELMKEWAPQAEKQLKARIIVESLIKDKNIAVSQEEIEAEFQRIADEAGVEVDEVKEHYNDQQAKEYIIGDIKEKKLYNDIFPLIKIQKGDTLTLEELFKK
jgi:trigger factor